MTILESDEKYYKNIPLYMQERFQKQVIEIIQQHFITKSLTEINKFILIIVISENMIL